MSTDERIANLEEAFLALNRLAKRADERHESVGESVRLLTEMQRGQSERLDDHLGWINQLGAAQAELTAATAESERRIAQLVDSQIQTEEAMRELREKMAESFALLTRMAVDMDARLAAVEGRDGKP